MYTILVITLFIAFASTHDEDYLQRYNGDEDYGSMVYDCEEEVDCASISGSKCVNGTCICENGSHCQESESVKVTQIGEECGETDICSINNSTCVEGQCECNEGYRSSQSRYDCLKVGNAFGATCTENIQCYGMRHSICRNGKCTCVGDRYESNRSCRRILKLGDKCESQKQCSKANFQECKQGTCQCIDRYISSGSKCLLIARNYLSPCEEDIQCRSSVLGDESICANNTCRCRPRYQYDAKMGECALVTLLGAICKDNFDCLGANLIDYHMTCSGNQCVCRKAYVVKDEQCISSATPKKPMSFIVLSSAFMAICYLICIPVVML